MSVIACAEKFKDSITEDKFRNVLLALTSVKGVAIDESKRPAYKPPTESFRKLAVD